MAVSLAGFTMIVITLMSLYFLLLLYKVGVLPYRRRLPTSRKETKDTGDQNHLSQKELDYFLEYSKFDDYRQYLSYLSTTDTNKLVAFVREINVKNRQDRVKGTAINKLFKIKDEDNKTDPSLNQYLKTRVDAENKLSDKYSESISKRETTEQVFHELTKYVLSKASVVDNIRVGFRLQTFHNAQVEQFIRNANMEDYVLFFDLFILDPFKGIAWIGKFENNNNTQNNSWDLAYVNEERTKRPNSVSALFAQRYLQVFEKQ